MRRLLGSTIVTVAMICFAAGVATASPLVPLSYSMPNGETGWWAYWDTPYTGSGCTNCDLSPLSGGLGKLTDGVTTNLNWFADAASFCGPESPESERHSCYEGAWVGWNSINPAITFHFDGTVTIHSVSLHVDNSSGRGDVYLPGSANLCVGVNCSAFSIADDPNDPSPRWITYDNLDFTGDTLTLTLGQRIQWPAEPYSWIFLDEVSIDGTTAPEPASLFLLGTGLAGLLTRRFRAR